MTVCLWAINGKGMGHTVGVSLVADLLRRRSTDLRFICESSAQARYLRQRYPDSPLLIAPRPWKVPGTEALASAELVARFLAPCSALIGDMFSLPPGRELLSLCPSGIKLLFIVRWMTHDRWRASVLGRLAALPGARVVVAVPESVLNETWGLARPVSAAELRDQLWYAPGFLFSAEQTLGTPGSALAFACGSGGTHSSRGSMELRETLEGLIAARTLLPSTAQMDAWVGRNRDLARQATRSGAFRHVSGLREITRPQWGQYSLVLARPSYNTLLEVMQTQAAFVTARYESDEEWGPSFFSFLERQGAYVLPALSRDAIRHSVVQIYRTRPEVSAERVLCRRQLFKSANSAIGCYVSEVLQC